MKASEYIKGGKEWLCITIVLLIAGFGMDSILFILLAVVPGTIAIVALAIGYDEAKKEYDETTHLFK